MTRSVPRLHLVTDQRVLQLPDFADRLRAVARHGVAIHARAPGMTARDLADWARVVTDVAAAAGAMVLVNDRAEIARMVNAGGVHLPEAGVPAAAARRIVGEEALVGRSVHTLAGARRAADDGADYVFLGPVWETASHPRRAAIGPGVLRGPGGIPVIAIGGITPERVSACLAAGAYGVAVISAVWDADDPGRVVGRMLVDLG